MQARVDQSASDKTYIVLATMGLTISDAMRMMLTRVANERALPFDPLIPNADTIAAMKAARAGKTAAFASVEDLMADLDADD